ncbi:MAG: tRNA (guanosine(37)-N1)-methyltransferase TrmD [candidate division WOR-3 bacterium]
MNINIFSIFPSLFHPFLEVGIVRRAKEKGIVSFNIINIRDFASDSYGTVDDYPYGGGPGMIMKVEPIVRALESVEEKKRGIVYLLSPRGEKFNQQMARNLAEKEALSLVCGRYKGVDERVRDFVDGEISIGDYILSGGEVAAMVIVEAIVRLLPGVVGNIESVNTDSFEKNILDAPYYTRPQDFRGKKVPDVLLSGDHKRIAKWREEEAIRLTKKYRMDIMSKTSLKGDKSG